MNHLHTMSALSLAALLLACDRTETGTSKNGSPVSETDKSGVTSMQPLVDTVTVSQLSVARCDRELACNNVGSGQRFPTHEACVDEVRLPVAGDLGSPSCPKGFDLDRIEGCAAAIRSDACDHALDTLGRIAVCRTDWLCAK